MLILNALTFLWLGCWAWRAVRALGRGVGNSLLFAYPILFVFCGIPLALDIVFGSPYYAQYPWFAFAADDQATAVIYCLFVSVCPVVWCLFEGRPQRNVVLDRRGPAVAAVRTVNWLVPLAAVIVIVPLVLAILSPDPSMYLEYAPNARHLRLRGVEERQVHMVLTKMVHLSIIAAAYLVYGARRLKTTLVLLMPFLLVDCWLQGKRNVVAFAIVLMLYALWRRGALPGRKVLLAAAAAAALLVGFSIVYQTQLRFSSIAEADRSFGRWLDNFRVDYGRDDVIKLAIYIERTHEAPPILDYRGQSIESIATMCIPRAWWENKPQAYGDYLMLAARGEPPPGGGSMTSSCLDEAIANFGWFGLLLGPLPLIVVCRLGDRCKSESIYLLTMFITCCLLTSGFSAWAHIAYLWVACVGWQSLRKMIQPRRLTRVARPLKLRPVANSHLQARAGRVR